MEPVKSPTPTLNSDGTVLPFPDRFHAAVQFVVNPVEGAAPIKDETRLVLYALHQQAVVGPCKEPKPWGWNVVESAKWNSWSQLRDMSSVEAMRLYVKVLEEEVQPDWWVVLRSADLQQKGGQNVPNAPRHKGLRDSAVAGEWAAVEVGGAKRPAPRYEHAVALLRRTLYLVGGNCGGRYLNDVWTLDLESLTWQQMSTTAAPVTADGNAAAESSSKEDAALLPPALPPLAGHALVAWGTSLLCIGGHTKGWQSKDPGQRMVVRALDTTSGEWSTLQPSGDAPPNRGSHTATLIGNRVYVFGGEDVARRGAGDLYVLDLASLEWSTPSLQGGPPARSAHVAAAVEDRFLLVFGGGSVARCYNDLWVLDTQEGVWSNPQPEGTPPSPRAGHAGDVLGGRWYVTGGGNNSSGCNDMLALNLAGLGGTPLVGTPSLRWQAVASVEPRASIASEGLSLSSLPEMGLLVAFGGYNGKYHSTVQVFRPDGGSSTKQASAEQLTQPASSTAAPAPAAPARSHKPVEPLLGKRPSGEVAAAGSSSPAQQPLANGHALPSGQAKGLSTEGQGRLASLEAVARDAQASREAMLSEMVLMRKQLNHALEAKAAVDKELEEVQAQLSAEQSKVFQLEVQLAEATQKLQLTVELEKEVGHYRKMIKEAEANKSKGGLWNYISGA